MARPLKDGRKKPGIYVKKGWLYIVITQHANESGKIIAKSKWIATGLKYTTDNLERAVQMRALLLDKETFSLIDRNITISDYLNLYLEKKKREVSDTTYSAYFYKARRISEAFESVKVKDINPRMVETFLDLLFEKDHASPRTVKDIKVLFGTIMDQAKKDGLIAYNPVKEVVINKKLASKYTSDKKADDAFFSYEEAQKFLDSAKGHALYELFYLTLFFGLRREEVLGLRWSAINFKDKTMKITHTVTKGMSITRANTTKTEASNREYPLSDEQIAMFQHLRKKELINRRLCGNSYYDSDYIFKHEDGTLYYPDYPTKAFGKLIRRTPELPQGITFHGLRSSCVSMLVHQGMDVKSIQKWVGHADINTTLSIYAKVKDKEAKREVSDAMAGMIQMRNYDTAIPQTSN